MAFNNDGIEWNFPGTRPPHADLGPEKPSHHHAITLHDAQDWFKRRKSSTRGSQRRSSLVLQRTTTAGKRWWKFTLRPWDDDGYQDWWFAGTAIPLLAATIGPLANVFSIAAYVTYWRMCLVEGAADARTCRYDPSVDVLVHQQHGRTFKDPTWCLDLNIVSLIAGFIGNIFLLCNFTGRIRYIIALPVTIVMWYIATGILMGITLSMHIYAPAHTPEQVYTGGFWYAVLAACMYMICSMLLMVNMLGYFLGHYPQHFTLTESQSTLILQTMLFFVWLAGGGGVFNVIESRYGRAPAMNWTYVNALYFCDVTILTVGFGDLYATSNLGRGLVLPYAVGGIIMLGLMVSSISKFAGEIGSDNIIRKHVENSRAKTVGRSVTTSLELERRQTFADMGHRPTISGPLDPVERPKVSAISFADPDDKTDVDDLQPLKRVGTLKKVASMVANPKRPRQPKLILLREEKDRFDAMRKIQQDTTRFKRWYALSLSILAFGLLWCGGAVVFWRCEHDAQGMTYFQALYFCYVSLLTIGYGDLSPVTAAGRAFFTLWSLIAVPTITILVTDLGETVINKFRRGTVKVADFTVLPKYGVWREWVERHPWLYQWLQQRKQKREAKERIEQGFAIGPDPDVELTVAPTIEELATTKPSKADLARKLAKKVRKVAEQVKKEPHKRYNYEEWVEITQLIRFTAARDSDEQIVDDEDDLIEWDWIGEDSPMMARIGEPEFVLDRLCESLQRYVRDVTSASTTYVGDRGDALVKTVRTRDSNDVATDSITNSPRSGVDGEGSSQSSSTAV